MKKPLPILRRRFVFSPNFATRVAFTRTTESDLPKKVLFIRDSNKNEESCALTRLETTTSKKYPKQKATGECTVLKCEIGK